MADEVPVSDDVLARVEALLVRRVGFQLPRWLVSSRVGQRLKLHAHETPETWVARLDGPDGQAEVDALCEALRVGETSFFRHRAHIAAVRKIVVPDLAARLASRRRVRAWSAGCASGEEAYTLALLLEEGLPGWSHELVATDLSPEAIAVARRGVYPSSSVRAVPPEALRRWFDTTPTSVTVRPELASKIRFEARNLLDPPPIRGADVIMCRNVLIYFEPDARARTCAQLVSALAPGGYLFLGYSESLRELEGLEPLRTDDGTVYRRPLRATTPVAVRVVPASPSASPSAPVGPPPAVATASASVSSSSPSTPATVRLSGEVRHASEVTRDLGAAIARHPRALIIDLDDATFLDDAIAPALRRAVAAAESAKIPLDFRARRPGPRRFLQRHRLGGRP